MKKKVLLVLLSACVAVVTLTSSSTGPAHTDNLNRSAVGCSGSSCHNATNSNNTIVGIVLVDKTTGNTVSDFRYTPGKIYRLYLLGNNISGLTKFGFQITCVQKAAPALQAGTFGNWPSTVWSKNISGIQVVEHATTLTTNVQGVDSVMMEWTAPPASAGTVRFNYMLNAVNGNSTSSGDEWNGSFSDFDPVTAGVPKNVDPLVVALFPNPTADVIHLSLKNAGEYLIRIISTTGKAMLTQQVKVNTARPFPIPVAQIPAGIYQLQVQGASGFQSVTFVKN